MSPHPSTNTLPIPLLQSEREIVVASTLEPPPTGLPVKNPTASFWLNSSPDANPLAKEGSTGALASFVDVCIIGSGITGISAAYHLANTVSIREAGSKAISAVVLEARDFCSGATGRNGGHLTPYSFGGFSAKEQIYGSHEAAKGFFLENYTSTEIVKIIKEHGLGHAVDLVEGGHQTLIFTSAEEAVLKEDFNGARNAGVNVDQVKWHSKEYMEENYGAQYPAVEAQGHNLWPIKFVTELYRLAKGKTTSLSLSLHTHTPVTSVSPLKDLSTSTPRWNVTTPRGSIACTYVIHATNAYASYLLPHLHGPEGIIPTRGQIIATRAKVGIEELGKSSWDGNDGYEYWFPRPLNSTTEKNPLVILGGGRETTNGFEYYTVDDGTTNPNIGQTLRKFLPAVFPGKFEVDKAPEMEWTGIMGYTKMRDPFVGPVIVENETLKGQYISAGYTGHGMPRAFACAEAVAGMVASEIFGHKWKQPEWLPNRYLTWIRGEASH